MEWLSKWALFTVFLEWVVGPFRTGVWGTFIPRDTYGSSVFDIFSILEDIQKKRHFLLSLFCCVASWNFSWLTIVAGGLISDLHFAWLSYFWGFQSDVPAKIVDLHDAFKLRHLSTWQFSLWIYGSKSGDWKEALESRKKGRTRNGVRSREM